MQAGSSKRSIILPVQLVLYFLTICCGLCRPAFLQIIASCLFVLQLVAWCAFAIFYCSICVWRMPPALVALVACDLSKRVRCAIKIRSRLRIFEDSGRWQPFPDQSDSGGRRWMLRHNMEIWLWHRRAPAALFEGLRQGTFSFVVLLRSSVCLKDPHWNTTDDERRRREKKQAKGFQGFLYGTSGGRNSRVSLRDLRGEKLDDGWPESVEEQGLLLLVWRHNCTNNIWKMCYRQSRRGVARQNSENLHRKHFYTQTLLHTKAFTHRSFYTQKLLHRGYYTQSFYPQKLLHTDAFTHRCFYTQTLLHGHFYTQTRLHTDTFTHRRFYTQTLLHTSQFYFSFWRSNLISCDRDVRKGRAGQVEIALEIAILPQFLPIEPHFVRKGCAGQVEIAISPQFLPIEPHFVRKGCAGRLEIIISPQFLTIEPHFVRKGCAGQVEIAILPQFLTIEPHFVRKGSPETRNRNFT